MNSLILILMSFAAAATDFTTLRPIKRTPFGCDLGSTTCTKATAPVECKMTAGNWPDNSKPAGTLPLGFLSWRGPYLNKAGFDNVKKINALPGSLSKEKFRSFDALITAQKVGPPLYKAHSSLVPESFPGLTHLDPAVYFDRTCVIEYDIYRKIYVNRCSIEQPVGREVCKLLFEPRVNYAVRSLAIGGPEYGYNTVNITDYNEKNKIRAAFYKSLTDPAVTPPVFGDIFLRNYLKTGESQTYFRKFYENNILFATPAVRSYSYGDVFAVLSPFVLQSSGASGTDARLLNPIIRASAAIPKPLKERIMNLQMLTPTLMQLFKTSISMGDYANQAAHTVAYILPPEANDVKLASLKAYDTAPPMSAPFLELITQNASTLTHIPPVARMKVLEYKIFNTSSRKYYTEPFFEQDVYGAHGALRLGEVLELTVDLWDSWTDAKEIAAYTSKVIRGVGSIQKLTPDGSIVKITIPYAAELSSVNTRSDVLLYVNDGKYNSAPAYISIKHVQSNEEKYYFK
jgi:hypothetical protein